MEAPMKRVIILSAAALVFALIVKSGFFVVDRGEAAVVSQFGKPVRVVEGPGVYVKAPLPVQGVRSYDRRLRVWDSEPREYATSDSASVVLTVYAAWKIQDPRTFAEVCGERERAEARIADVVSSELGAAVARHPLRAFVSTQAADIRTPDVLRAVRRECDAAARAFGVEIADVGATCVTLPDGVRQAIIDRMSAEQEAAASLELAAGEEEAGRIRAAADSERQAVLADARRESERIRGEADAAAMRIYADAHKADPEFYAFLRTLDSYKAFMDDKTTVVLSSDSQLLRLLEKKE
jgi:modulator of FtsH protease HflC